MPDTSLERIERKIDLIIKRLDDLECKTAHVETSCDRMDSHIGFVESVYSNCRHPLNWLLQKIGGLSGRQHIHARGVLPCDQILPELPDDA